MIALKLLVANAKMGDVVSKCNGIEVDVLTSVGLGGATILDSKVTNGGWFIMTKSFSTCSNDGLPIFLATHTSSCYNIKLSKLAFR